MEKFALDPIVLWMQVCCFYVLEHESPLFFSFSLVEPSLFLVEASVFPGFVVASPFLFY
jgi:hypothetical protein